MLRVELSGDTPSRMGASLAVLALVAIRVVEAPPPRPASSPNTPQVAPDPLVDTTEQAPSHEPTSDDRRPESEAQSGASLTTDEAETRVVRSCAAALGSDSCLPHGGVDPTIWSAKVRFSTSDVEVTLSRDATSVIRRLPFSEADNDEQRLVAAGLLVAAMTASAQLSKENEEEDRETLQDEDRATQPPPEPTSPELAPEVPKPHHLPHATLDLSVLAAPVFAWDRLGLGGTLSVTWWGHARVGPLIQLGGLHSLETNPRGLALNGSAGLSIDLLGTRATVRWLLLPVAVVEALRVDRVDGSDGVETAVRAGGRLGTMWVPRLHGRGLVPHAGLDFSLLTPEVEVRRDGETLGKALVARAGIFAGISWKTR